MKSASTAKKSHRTQSLQVPFSSTNVSAISSRDISKEMNYDEVSPTFASKAKGGINHGRSTSVCKLGNIKVMCRVRPMNELESKSGALNCIRISLDKTITVKVGLGADLYGKPKVFNLDKVFDSNATQPQVYEIAAKPILQSVFEGYNGTIIAYGQTFSGKTYTMFGDEISKSRGILQRVIVDLFSHMKECSENTKMSITVSAIEINNEKIIDLLSSNKKTLKIREDRKKGSCLDDITEIHAKKKEDIVELSHLIDMEKTAHSAGLNSMASKSHIIFMINVYQTDLRDSSKKHGKLLLVDLAGSENTNHNEKIFGNSQISQEAKAMNRSLTALRTVVKSLGSAKHYDYNSYRDSVLTRLLKESFGGSCKTCVLITCSPSSLNDQESVESLKFGYRARFINNTPKINRESTLLELQNAIIKAQKEIDHKDKRIHHLEFLLKDQGAITKIEPEDECEDSTIFEDKPGRILQEANGFYDGEGGDDDDDDESHPGSVFLHEEDRFLNKSISNILNGDDETINDDEDEDQQENQVKIRELEKTLDQNIDKLETQTNEDAKLRRELHEAKEELAIMLEENVALANRSKLLNLKIKGLEGVIKERDEKIEAIDSLRANMVSENEKLLQTNTLLAQQLKNKAEKLEKSASFSFSKSNEYELNGDGLYTGKNMNKGSSLNVDGIEKSMIDAIAKKYNITDRDDLSKLIYSGTKLFKNIHQTQEVDNISKEDAFNSEIMELRPNNVDLTEDLLREKAEVRRLRVEFDKLLEDYSQAASANHEKEQSLIEQALQKQAAKHESEKNDLLQNIQNRTDRVIQLESELKILKEKYKELVAKMQAGEKAMIDRFLNLQKKEKTIINIVDHDMQSLKNKAEKYETQVKELKNSRKASPLSSFQKSQSLLKSPAFEQVLKGSVSASSNSFNKENLDTNPISNKNALNRSTSYKPQNLSSARRKSTLDMKIGVLTSDRQFLHPSLDVQKKLEFNGET